jgi:hypothetical protein
MLLYNQNGHPFSQDNKFIIISIITSEHESNKKIIKQQPSRVVGIEDQSRNMEYTGTHNGTYLDFNRYFVSFLKCNLWGLSY